VDIGQINLGETPTRSERGRERSERGHERSERARWRASWLFSQGTLQAVLPSAQPGWPATILNSSKRFTYRHTCASIQRFTYF